MRPQVVTPSELRLSQCCDVSVTSFARAEALSRLPERKVSCARSRFACANLSPAHVRSGS